MSKRINLPAWRGGIAALCMGAFLGIMGVAQPAMAQDNAPAYDRSKLEDITVQTQKRVESAQTVPVAVTAFSGTKLEREFAVTLEDFNHSIPNVQLEHVGLFQAAASFSMRGIGTSGIESFADPVVAVFVDGAYYSRNAVSLLDLFDIEAIEVMRGPQGTLYGRNAFAGAVSVRTHRPDMNEFTGHVEMDFGNAGRMNVGVIGNFPVVEDKVAIRFAANYHKLNGFFKNDGLVYTLAPDGGGLFGAGTPTATVDDSLKGKRLNGEKSVYFRPSIRFTPNDKLDVSIIGEVWRDRGDGTANWSQCYQPNSFPPPLGAGPSGVPDLHTLLGWPCKDPFGDPRFGIEGDGSDPFEVGFELTPNRTNHNVWGITLDASYETDAGTFELMVNHREVTEDITTDTDGFNGELFSSSRIQDFDSTQGELRFISDFSDKIDLIVGAFFLKDQYKVGQLLWIFADSGLYGGGGFGRDNPLMSYGENSQDRKSWALYAQINYHMTDQLSLVLGGRYTHEKKYNVMGMAINDSVCPDGVTPVALGGTGLCNGAPFSGDNPGDFTDFNPGVQFGPNSENWNAFSPRVGLDYQMNDDVLLFAFWQRAHKSGGFVNNAGTLAVFNSPYGQESVDNFEIGMKSDWLDNTLRINVNAFYAKYHDLQRGVIRAANTSTGQETFTDNAAGAESKGVELEFSWLPAEGLTIFGVVGWLDIEYKGFIADINGDGVATDNSGLDLVRAPKWDLQFGINYDLDLGNSGLLNFGARMSYTSSMVLTTPNDVGFYRSPLTTIDLNVNWEPANGNYRISVWGKNVNNDIERLGGTPVATLFAFASPTQPRQYGISLAADF